MSLPAAAPAAEPLLLDARQRAMLAEMGVRLWWPQDVATQAFDSGEADSAASAVSPQSASAAAVALVPSTSPAATPARALRHQLQPPAEPHAQQVQAAPIRAANPSEAQPHRPAAQAQPQAQIQPQAHALPGGASASAAPAKEGMRWLLVLDPPGLGEQARGEPVAQADVRRLLVNMMAAVRLDAAQTYHFCAAQAVVAPGQMLSEAELAPWRTQLRQEIQRLQPQLLLCLGRHAAYSVLGSQAPLGQLRGQAHCMAGPVAASDATAATAAADGAKLPVVVSYPPAYLLRNPAAKRQAWQDLCLAHALAQAALPAASAGSAESA